jgi:quinoprotein relay system zinc metallohydrolase 2
MQTYKQHYSAWLIATLLLLSQVSCADNDYPVKQAAEGIFYHEGAQEDATPENKGEIANVGFIIGDNCVAVVDSGGSFAEGESLRAAIRSKTRLPVCYVINTHVHPDHLLGNAAFKGDKPSFVGNSKLPAALLAREGFYEERFKDILGDAYNGAEFIEPDKLVELGKPQTLDLGNRTLTLTAYPTAHTDNDLTVFDQKTQTLWTGDLLFVERTPALDGSINGWLQVMDDLEELSPKTVIPGHGPVQHENWKQALDAERQYFALIRQQIRDIIFDMGTINQATDTVGQSEKENWLLFEDYHKRNVTAAFTELEWE